MIAIFCIPLNWNLSKSTNGVRLRYTETAGSPPLPAERRGPGLSKNFSQSKPRRATSSADGGIK